MLIITVTCPFSIAYAECIPGNPSVPLCLSGTATAPSYRGAVIEEAGRGERLVRPGDSVGDWRVDQIGARYVTFVHGGDQVRLDLANLPSDPPPPTQPDAPRRIKQGPMVHARSLARGGD